MKPKKLREVHDIFTVGATGIDTSEKVGVFRPLVFLTVPESTVPEWNTEEDKEKYKQALETENEKLRQVSDQLAGFVAGVSMTTFQAGMFKPVYIEKVPRFSIGEQVIEGPSAIDILGAITIFFALVALVVKLAH